MKDNVFIDTNIWIYSITESMDGKDQLKKSIALNLIKQVNIFSSTQVLIETSNVLFKNYNKNIEYIKKFIENIKFLTNIHIVDYYTINLALEVKNKNKISFSDSLIAASALIEKCAYLYTEDMHNNLIINRKLKIINPFIN